MQDRSQLNRILQSHGLGRLEDGAGLMAQLGFLVEDHNHLRDLIAKCDPAERWNMYESLKPYLGFEAHSLDWYVSEAGRMAEAKQLPVMAPDGALKPFLVPQVHSDAAFAQDAINRAFAKEVLTLTCAKCTKVAQFPGDRKIDAVFAARAAGWTYNELNNTGREICPACDVAPTSREEFKLVCEFKLCSIATISRYLSPVTTWTRDQWDIETLKAARRWDADGRPTVNLTNLAS